MNSPADIAQKYLRTWNETDPAQRAELMRRYWTEDASYVDPLMRGDGAAQIDGLVAAVHQRFPNHRFTAIGTPDGHGDHVRLSWALGPAGGASIVEGSDTVTLKDGRIDRVIGFIDRSAM